MKKILAMTLCATMALSLSACKADTKPAPETAASTAAVTKEETKAVPGSETALDEKEESKTGIANPFVDCKTMEEAQEAAGFELTVPEKIDGYGERSIQAVKDQMIQVVYASDQDKITIRKGAGSEDISGDYNSYTEESVVTIHDTQVTMKGNDGKVSLAVWTKDDCAYSVSVMAGISSESMGGIIQEIK